MKTVCISLLTLAAVLPLQSEAAPISLSDSIQIEPITAISTQELWSTSESRMATSGVVIVEQLGIDPESASVRGKWHACALILIGTTDVGIRPVAVRLWASRPCGVSVSTISTPNAAVEAKFSLNVADGQNFAIRVGGTEKVSISGVALGSIGY
jgi:hypothetical protein